MSLYLIGSILVKLILAYSLIIVPSTGVYQEYKVSVPPPIPSLSIVGMIKAYLLFALWVSLTFLGTTLLLPQYIFYGCQTKSVEHSVNTLVERMSAIILALVLVGPVKVRGRDNLPPVISPNGKGVIFIANHSSTIDSSVTYYLFRTFKWVAKRSILYMPGVGATMWMGGHVLLDRKSKDSKNQMYQESHILLSKGQNLFVFPQGTRKLAEWLPFRDGAFKLALEGGYTLVPVSIELPRAHWNSGYPLNLLWGVRNRPVIVTVHPVIPVEQVEERMEMEEKKEILKQQCEDIILSALPHFRKIIESSSSSSSSS